MALPYRRPCPGHCSNYTESGLCGSCSMAKERHEAGRFKRALEADRRRLAEPPKPEVDLRQEAFD